MRAHIAHGLLTVRFVWAVGGGRRGRQRQRQRQRQRRRRGRHGSTVDGRRQRLRYVRTCSQVCPVPLRILYAPVCVCTMLSWRVFEVGLPHSVREFFACSELVRFEVGWTFGWVMKVAQFCAVVGWVGKTMIWIFSE